MFVLHCGDFGEIAEPSIGPREEILALLLTELDHGILKTFGCCEDGHTRSNDVRCVPSCGAKGRRHVGEEEAGEALTLPPRYFGHKLFIFQ
jgi:hypothetical protein